MDRPVLASLQRVWLAAIQLALLLPFATVQDCSTHETRTYTGLELYFSPDRLGLVLPIGFVLLLLMLFPWNGGRSEKDAVGAGLRSWVAGVGAMVSVAAPGFAFLFDNVEPHIGWYLHGGGWGVTSLVALVLAVVLLLRPDATPAPKDGPWSRPELVGVGLLIVLPLLVGGVVMALSPTQDEGTGTIVLLAAGFLSAAPLVVTGLALARAVGHRWEVTGQRVLWWFATVATAISYIGALVDD